MNKPPAKLTLEDYAEPFEKDGRTHYKCRVCDGHGGYSDAPFSNSAECAFMRAEEWEYHYDKEHIFEKSVLENKDR